MAYTRHHAIVVTAYDATIAEQARTAAIDVGCIVTDIQISVNGYASFLVAPDGSNEGWPESRVGQTTRDRFVARLRAHDLAGCDWVEVQFGDDHGNNIITRDSSTVNTTRLRLLQRAAWGGREDVSAD